MAKLYPHYDLAKAIGEPSLDLDVKNVRELLALLKNRYRAHRDKFPRNLSILVNGRNINYAHGLDTKLGDDDEVWFMLPSGGG